MNQIINFTKTLTNLFNNSINERILQSILIFIIAYLLLQLIKITATSRLEIVAQKTANKFDDLCLEIINSYGSLFYIFTPLYVTSLFTNISSQVDDILYKISIIIFTYYIAKTVTRIIIFTANRALEINSQKNNEKIDPSLQNIINLFIKIAIWVITFLIILQNLNYNVTTLLGGLGIFGIAIAFGMQNILADLFSFFTIYFDKPFKAGDYIIINDTPTQAGTVKHVGLKSTRIKTQKGDELIIPNQQIAKSIVNNYKRMKKRRVDFDFSISYDTPQTKIKKIPDIVKKIIDNISSINFIHCKLRDLGEYAIIYTCAFTIENTDYETYLNIREEILMNILDKFQKQKIKLAYPTQSLLIKKQQ
jgi:small-conductance mechanosensitive channel